MKVHELHRCPSCGEDDAEEIDLGHDRRLRRCRRCTLVFAPEFADPSEIYVDGYLRGETEFGLDISHPIFQRFLEFAAAQRLAIIERAAGGRGSLLDVGCGSGEVLRVAVARGWRGAGAEPVEESAAIAQAKGLDVRCALLEESGLPEASFDVVSAFHVLEHMNDGTAFLRLVRRWARPGGHVVVEVPNWRSMHRRGFGGAAWPGLRPLEHVAHYEPRSLQATLERAGLDDVKVRTTTFLYGEQTLDEALSDLGLHPWRRWLAPLGRVAPHKDGPTRLPRKAAWPLLRLAARTYDAARVGQVLIGIARVPG